MSTLGFRGTATAIVAGAMLLTLASSRSARAQDKNEIAVTISAADKSAAAQVTNRFRTASPLYAQRGKASQGDRPLALRPSSVARREDSSSKQNTVRYPADLSYLGGPTVEYSQSHAVYLLPNGHCPVSQCWGDPEGFLKDLSNSDFIHLVDQYVGLFASRRYSLGTAAKLDRKSVV